MIEEFIGVSTNRLIEASTQTIYMLGWSLFLGTLLGIPLALLLVLTRSNGLKENRIVYTIINSIVNIVRSIPFIILLVFIQPLTRAIVGTGIGMNAAIVPLVFYIAPFIGRLIESALLEVDSGILEAAKSMGANTWEVIRYFLLPEAKASIYLAMATATVGLLGATAMAGTIGGGGVGNLALTYGYQRFNDVLMLVTVVVLVIFVQCIQGIGNKLADRARNKA